MFVPGVACKTSAIQTKCGILYQVDPELNAEYINGEGNENLRVFLG